MTGTAAGPAWPGPVSLPPMINPELTLYLAVTGYGDDPAMVTTLLGIEPTEVWVRGQPFSASFPDARRTRSQWMLASGLERDARFRDHCAALLALLEPRAERLRLLRERCSVGIAVGRYFHTGDPDFFLDEQTVARFRVLGLEPAFDQLPERD